MKKAKSTPKKRAPAASEAQPPKKSKAVEKPAPPSKDDSSSSELHPSELNEESPFVVCRNVTDWQRFEEFVSEVEHFEDASMGHVCRVLVHDDDALLQFYSAKKVKDAWGELPKMIPAERYERVSAEEAENPRWKYPVPESLEAHELLEEAPGMGFTHGTTEFAITYRGTSLADRRARLSVMHAGNGPIRFIHPEQFEKFAELCTQVAKSFRAADRTNYRREFQRVESAKQDGHINLWLNVVHAIGPDADRKFNFTCEIGTDGPEELIPE